MQLELTEIKAAYILRALEELNKTQTSLQDSQNIIDVYKEIKTIVNPPGTVPVDEQKTD